MKNPSRLLLCIFVAFLTAETAYKDESIQNNPRPFYNIARMANNRKQLDAWLNWGANAIENDVSFAVDGTPSYFYHGIPCDAFRICSRWDYIKPYIEAVRARTEPESPKFNPKFTLLLFDLKVRKLNQHVLARAGRQFTDKFLIPLFNNASRRLKEVVSVLDYRKTDIIPNETLE